MILLQRLLLVFFLVSFSANAFGQGLIGEEVKESVLYAKIGFVYTDARSIYGFGSSIGGLSIELENYFAKNHLGLSGWSLGYRKDDLSIVDVGHFLNFEVLREMGSLKISTGVEFGIFDFSLDQTRFNYVDGELVSYDHIFPHRNIKLPWEALGFYPILEASLVKRNRYVIAEFGLRASIRRFGLSRYDLSGGLFKTDFSDKLAVVPSFFASVGVPLRN